jgi:broad specificity phosphatase PhoE
VTRFVLVRHGQTEWNREERFRGRADVPLNATGLSQARATGERIAGEWKVAAAYSSPLSRAVRTAEAIGAHFDLHVQGRPNLADIDYGQWQGLTPDEARARWPEEVEAWYSAAQDAHIPGGETLAAVRARAMAEIGNLGSFHPVDTIVLVGHTVINRIILLGVLGLGNERFWHLRQEPCAISVFEGNGSDFDLVLLNDTSHLRAVE